MRGGPNASSTARGTDTATTSATTPPLKSVGEPVDEAFAPAPSASARTATTGAGAGAGSGAGAGAAGATAAASSDLAQGLPRPYEAFLTGSLEKFESGEGNAAERGGARPQTTGGSGKGGSQERRPWSSGYRSQPKSLEARRSGKGTASGEEDGGRKEERWKEKDQQPRAKGRPKTAGAGSGGVQGVLARMGGYEKVTIGTERKALLVGLSVLYRWLSRPT